MVSPFIPVEWFLFFRPEKFLLSSGETSTVKVRNRRSERKGGKGGNGSDGGGSGEWGERVGGSVGGWVAHYKAGLL